MKFALSTDACNNMKLVAARARTRAVREEDTAVYIEAKADDTVYVMATSDTNVVYECTIKTDVYEPGVCSTPGVLLNSVLCRLAGPAVVVSMVKNNTSLQFTSGDTVVNLPVFFFQITKPEIKENTRLSAPSHALLAAFNDVNFAVAEASRRLDTRNLMLTTMNVTVNEGIATFEGVQNAYASKISFPTNCENCNFAIPHELAVASMHLFKEQPNSDADVQFDSTRIAISVGNFRVSCLRIVGKFLDTTALYDKNTDAAIIVNTDCIKKIVSMALAVTSERDMSPIILTLPAVGDEGVIKLDYKAEFTEVHDIIPCSVELGKEAVSVAYSPKFLDKVLKNISDEELTIYFSYSSRPTIIALETEKNGIKYTRERILAPIRR